MATTCPHGVKAAEFVSSLGSILAGLALALSTVPVWGADRGLFIPLDAADAALFAPPSVSQVPFGGGQLREGQAPPNGWLVRVDRRRLFQTIHAVERSGSGRLVLNVAEGLEFEVAADRTERTLSGHSLSGRVVGVAGGAVTFAVHAEAVMGTVWTPGAVYEIVPLKDGVHVVREVDLSARPPLGEPIRTEGGWGELRPIEQANGDSDAEVDVLVLWTPMTMANTGSEAQMRAGIDLAVAWTNDAYQRSGAEVRLNLVGAEPIDYVEDGDSEIDLGRLSHPSDGFLTRMHEVATHKRPAYFEDLVATFNPADADATITIGGVDDADAPPPEGDVTLTLPAGAATAITAQQLEAGADHFEGRFGDGKGKWRLFIEADQDVQVMSLLESPTGHITNLSSGTAVR